MTQTGDNAVSVLVDQIDDHVRRIETVEDGTVCPGHRPLAEGVVLLLKIRKAEYKSNMDAAREARSAVVASAAALLVSIATGLGAAVWSIMNGGKQ